MVENLHIDSGPRSRDIAQYLDFCYKSNIHEYMFLLDAEKTYSFAKFASDSVVSGA